MSTGQIEDPELTARMKAGELKDKENLTLAEKLILKSAQRTLSFEYEGEDIEVYVPNAEEYGQLAHLNKVLMDQTSEDMEGDANKLFTLVASLMVDGSINEDVLKSGALGISFIPKIIYEVSEYEKDKATEKTRIANFRKK